MAITIDLLNVDGLALMWPGDSLGLHNLAPSNCWSQDKHLNASGAVTSDDLKSRKRDPALDVVMDIFSKFNWPEPPRDEFAALQSERFCSIG